MNLFPPSIGIEVASETDTPKYVEKIPKRKKISRHNRCFRIVILIDLFSSIIYVFATINILQDETLNHSLPFWE